MQFQLPIKFEHLFTECYLVYDCGLCLSKTSWLLKNSSSSDKKCHHFKQNKNFI